MPIEIDPINWFERIRSACQQVAESAKHVEINYDRLDDYASTLPLEKVKSPPLDPTAHYLGHEKDTIAFFLTLETINFGSGYFPHLDKHGRDSGYFTVAAALKEHFNKNGPFTAQVLSRLSTRDCSIIFKQSSQNKPIQELMALFAEALNQLGYFLLEHFDGKYEAVIEAADHSAKNLINLLIQIPYFKDISKYGDLQVPLLKRAQITAADISLAFSNRGLGYFKDLDQLTIFADNMIPHVLRCDGILTYDEKLSGIVDDRKILSRDSEEEVEIRACAIHTVEMLRKKFNQLGFDFTSVELDYLLWNGGQESAYKNKFPVHLTRTMFY